MHKEGMSVGNCPYPIFTNHLSKQKADRTGFLMEVFLFWSDGLEITDETHLTYKDKTNKKK
jgi:hypothetical protein